MFPLMSRFVPICESSRKSIPRKSFAKIRFRTRLRPENCFRIIAPFGASGMTRLSYFAISGARFTAGRYCGRISLVVALSWIGARGSFAVPGSMMKV